jgi:hypothetical protein
MIVGWSDSLFLNIIIAYIGICVIFVFIAGIVCLCVKVRECCCGDQTVAYRKVNESDDDEVLVKVVHQENSKLTAHAIKCHIYPTCSGNKDAEEFSRERDAYAPVSENTVLKVSPQHFHREGMFLRSDKKVPFWECRRNSRHDFKVRNDFFFKYSVNVLDFPG